MVYTSSQQTRLAIVVQPLEGTLGTGHSGLCQMKDSRLRNETKAVKRTIPDPTVSQRRLFQRALLAWLILISVEFVHGTLRAIFLVPVVGDFRSRQIGVFTGSILILAVAYLLFPWLDASDKKSLLSVGALWVALTVAFEFAFGRVLGRSWGNVASDYDILRGGFLLIGMAVLMFSPVIAVWMRMRGR
jgi:hypothetical protein